MRYIKTKDGKVIEIKAGEWYWCEDFFGNNALHQINPPFNDIEEEDIVAKADNIEDLCDFIFAKDKYGDYKLYDLKDWKNTDEEYLKESRMNGWLEELYYCVKTDKGIIFAAKMNDEGELL